jgi:Heparinase II/III-like protein/Heparinase II/III N-terminus
MAQRIAVGDDAELTRLNDWLDDWSEQNPPYLGANWKCGQEASIRVIHLAIAALILQNHVAPSCGLLSLVRTHLLRIAPTIGYAIGQNNNHGTSEAAALFIGGSWLAQHGDRIGNSWSLSGRRWLEDRARSLIAPDGTFSQHSVVYHRLMIDTYSACEVWRAKLEMQPFSDELRSRLAKAVHWQQQMLDPDTGHVPNIGANDGARLMPLDEQHYRDFRTSTQFAAALFCGRRAIVEAGAWDMALRWFDTAAPTAALPPPTSSSFSDGGFHILRAGNLRCYFRAPRYRFRPSQCDALHVDLWTSGGLNLIRDGGTFSYNSSDEDYRYFSGSKSHNNAEFDGRDQMPRISRFLFGSWLQNTEKTQVELADSGFKAQAGYRDYRGAGHLRKIALTSDNLRCEDVLGGQATNAVIRWRLAPSDWRLEGNVATDGKFRLAISSPSDPFSLELATGAESLHYLEKSPIAVLEIHCAVPSTIISEISF